MSLTKEDKRSKADVEIDKIKVKNKPGSPGEYLPEPETDVSVRS